MSYHNYHGSRGGLRVSCLASKSMSISSLVEGMEFPSVCFIFFIFFFFFLESWCGDGLTESQAVREGRCLAIFDSSRPDMRLRRSRKTLDRSQKFRAFNDRRTEFCVVICHSLGIVCQEVEGLPTLYTSSSLD